MMYVPELPEKKANGREVLGFSLCFSKKKRERCSMDFLFPHYKRYNKAHQNTGSESRGVGTKHFQVVHDLRQQITVENSVNFSLAFMTILRIESGTDVDS